MDDPKGLRPKENVSEGGGSGWFTARVPALLAEGLRNPERFLHAGESKGLGLEGPVPEGLGERERPVCGVETVPFPAV